MRSAELSDWEPKSTLSQPEPWSETAPPAFEPAKCRQIAGYSAETRKRRFASDCVVVDALQIEPVSTSNSLLTGKLTGNFGDSGAVQSASEFNDFQRNSLRNGTGNFCRPNREFFFKEQGIPTPGVSVHCSHACFAPAERDLFSLAFLQKVRRNRWRTDGGVASVTARPSALAVVRFRTGSNLVGCSTGMLAGFAPCRNRTCRPACVSRT